MTPADPCDTRHPEREDLECEHGIRWDEECGQCETDNDQEAGAVMKTSDKIDKLATALAKAQGSIRHAKLDGANPHFNSRFATLASIHEAIRGPLNAAGLAWTQGISNSEGKVLVTTRLLHASGQWLETSVAGDAGRGVQGMGSTVTYLRRYCLAAIVGVASGDDDDGENTGATATDGRISMRPEDAPHHPSWDADRGGFCAGLARVRALSNVPAVNRYDRVKEWCLRLGQPKPSAMDKERRQRLTGYMGTDAGDAKLGAFLDGIGS